MDAFIKKYQFNYIEKLMKQLENTFISCVDIDIINTCKATMQEKIYNEFNELNEEQRELLNIEKIKGIYQISIFIKKITPYVCGMPEVSKAQIQKLFKKEKKLKLPKIDNIEFSSLTYLGWRDVASNKLYIVYSMNDKLVGLTCRGISTKTNASNMCALCRCGGTKKDVAFVSVVSKSSENYKSLGFYICMDSQKCNERITSISKLEEIIRKTS
ncbi:FusB/FusC family EF-G-binding protein [Oceanirhabdus sp. W0125-5]|uniref:FusB/FusC family EF-G-binding protein n=1 Tax=Oceanirhabdus sp. W0125-5 TaxID=2999116 RepID=UPI0022F3266D|nr:FusB/FusC family EF-G-binding protein [Oceanirhabdus sp. W0125-5]WBW98445.1 FusB/FusC family EF-G-binding protein [Oceanirhabdus sp. W0125-5]